MIAEILLRRQSSCGGRNATKARRHLHLHLASKRAWVVEHGLNKLARLGLLEVIVARNGPLGKILPDELALPAEFLAIGLEGEAVVVADPEDCRDRLTVSMSHTKLDS